MGRIRISVCRHTVTGFLIIPVQLNGDVVTKQLPRTVDTVYS